MNNLLWEIDDEYKYFISPNIKEITLGWFHKKLDNTFSYNEKIIFTFLYTVICWTETITSKYWYVVENFIKSYIWGNEFKNKNYFGTHTNLFYKRKKNPEKFDKDFNIDLFISELKRILNNHIIHLPNKKIFFEDFSNIITDFINSNIVWYDFIFTTQFYFDFWKNMKIFWVLDVDFSQTKRSDFKYDIHTKKTIEEYLCKEELYLDELLKLSMEYYISKWYDKGLFWIIIESLLCTYWSNFINKKQD